MITENDVAAFVASVNAMLADHNQNSGFNWSSYVEANIGKKYAKIVKRENHNGNIVGGSAFCFIDMQTGDILKAASWAAPAKGVRGNIFQGLTGLTPYGAIYFR